MKIHTVIHFDLEDRDYEVLGIYISPDSAVTCAKGYAKEYYDRTLPFNYSGGHEIYRVTNDVIITIKEEELQL